MAETPAADLPSPFDPTLPPSSSLLFYLHAEHVAPVARSGGMKAPLADVRVEGARLAYALFAVAFWQLRETGLVHLATVHERRFLKARTRLHATRRSPGGEGQRVAHDGIEGGILDVLTNGYRAKTTPAWESRPQWMKTWSERVQTLAALPNSPLPSREVGSTPPDTVAAVLEVWYGRAMLFPERLPIEWTEREGVAKGFLTVADAQRNPIAAVFLGKTTLVPQRERIIALAPAFSQLLAGWRAFTASEPTLAVQLEREIVAGVDARRDQRDTSTT